jgi:hypothetical protein
MEQWSGRAEVRRIVVLISEDRARMRSHRMRDTGQDYALPAILASRQADRVTDHRYWQ